MSADYEQLGRALSPEGALVVGALAVLGIDRFGLRRQAPAARLRAAVAVGVAAAVAAIGLAVNVGRVGEVFGGVLMIDAFAAAGRVAILGLTALGLLVATGGRIPRPPAEFVAVMLLATCGFLLMAASQQLLVAFLALELGSVSLYVLAGFDSARAESAEAAVKYFLFGAMSAAALLFGFSLIYGITGSIDLPTVARALAGAPASPLLAVALVLVLVGFGFKAAAAPFHLWAPDAYQGAPAPAAAVIASGSKLAGMVLFSRLLWSGFGGAAGSWVPIVAIVCAASLLLGNLVALAQSDLRRLLAYSAIAHAGAMLLGVVAVGKSGPAPLFYYAATYGIALVGLFGVVAVLDGAGVGPRLTDLAGLHRRSPFLAGCLLIFILSLAGVPPLAGFFGKFAVFAAALKSEGAASPIGWLVFLAIGLSAVALYYYLAVLKQAWVAPAGAEGRIRTPGPAAAALAIAALLVLLFGLFPSQLLRWL